MEIETNSDFRHRHLRLNRAIIERSGLSFQEKANGHFIMDTPLGKVDFWGTTDLGIIRSTQQRFYDILDLLKLINNSNQ